MKEKLTLRNLLVCCAVLFGLLVFIFSFITSVKGYDGGGNYTGSYKNVVWGCSSFVMPNGTEMKAAKPYDACVLQVIGAILVLVAAICAGVLAFAGEKLVKNEKVRKIVMLVAGGMMVVGAVFAVLTPLSFFDVLAKEYAEQMHCTVEQAKEALKAGGGTLSAPMSIVSGILALLGGGAVVASQFVPDKKLVK